MASITSIAAARGRLEVAGRIARLRAAWADLRLYQRTLGELQRLSDRELADLGLSRHDLRRVARESVYGYDG